MLRFYRELTENLPVPGLPHVFHTFGGIGKIAAFKKTVPGAFHFHNRFSEPGRNPCNGHQKNEEYKGENNFTGYKAQCFAPLMV